MKSFSISELLARATEAERAEDIACIHEVAAKLKRGTRMKKPKPVKCNKYVRLVTIETTEKLSSRELAEMIKVGVIYALEGFQLVKVGVRPVDTDK